MDSALQGLDRIDDAGCRVMDDYRRVSECDVCRVDDRSDRMSVTVNVTQNNNGVPATTSTLRPVPAPTSTTRTTYCPPPVSSASCSR